MSNEAVCRTALATPGLLINGRDDDDDDDGSNGMAL